jgi:hypothetical protein
MIAASIMLDSPRVESVNAFAEILEGHDVAAWDHQGVSLIHWTNVQKCHCQIILQDDARRDLLVENLAKHAVSHVRDLKCRRSPLPFTDQYWGYTLTVKRRSVIMDTGGPTATTRRAEYRFRVKELAEGRVWIMLELFRGDNLPCMGDGFFGFDLKEGTTYEQATEVCKVLNANIVSISHTGFIPEIDQTQPF